MMAKTINTSARGHEPEFGLGLVLESLAFVLVSFLATGLAEYGLGLDL